MKRTERVLINKKKKQKRNKKFMVLVSAAIIIATATFNNGIYEIKNGTYASFSDKKSSNVVVASSKIEDIIKMIDIGYNNDICNVFGSGLKDGVYINPASIKLKKAENISFTPIMYFSVEGDASNYILNINPVKLESGNEVSADIRLKLTCFELNKLILTGKEYPVEGKIVVKYLNEYVNIEKKIKFSRAYLLYNYLLQPNNVNDFNNVLNSNMINEKDKNTINSIVNNNKEIKGLVEAQKKK